MNTFQDRAVTISATKILAATLGALGTICVVVNFWLPHHNLGHASVPLIGGAAVLRIKSYFCVLNQRWAAAFEQGRVVGHEQAREEMAGLRPVR